MRSERVFLKTLMFGFFAAAALFAAAGCGKGGPGGGQRPAPEVAVMTVKPEKLVLTTELPGRVSALRVAQIRPQVNGLILERLFEEGSDVVAGQVLYLIDPAPFKAALTTAQAALGRAEASLASTRSRAARYKGLLASRAVSQQDYDDASAALTQVEADIAYWKASEETARINLGYTEVKAPISGRIGKSNVTDGAIVTAYQPLELATVQEMDRVYVDIPQSSAELLALKRRMNSGRIAPDGEAQSAVRLVLEDGSAYESEGRLEFSDVTVDSSTGSVILRALFPNPDGILLPGMFVRAAVKEGVDEKAVLVPQQAVSRDNKGTALALVVGGDGKVEQRELVCDRAVGGRWLISSGLKAGDRVVVEGMQKARHGMSVKSVEFNGAAAAAKAS